MSKDEDPSPLDRSILVSVAVGSVVFGMAICLGLASAHFRDRPFPVTRVLMTLYRKWSLFGFPWP